VYAVRYINSSIYTSQLKYMNTPQRVNRIIGQLRGIQKMVDDDRECGDILQQILAVKKAINGVTKDIIVQSLTSSKTKQDQKKIEQLIAQALNI